MSADDVEQTPLERLDQAVQEFIRSQPDYAGALVSGWALGYEVTSADGDGLWWDTQYATGPSTSPAAGVGVAQLAQAKMLRDLVYDDED